MQHFKYLTTARQLANRCCTKSEATVCKFSGRLLQEEGPTHTKARLDRVEGPMGCGAQQSPTQLKWSTELPAVFRGSADNRGTCRHDGPETIRSATRSQCKVFSSV